MRKNPWYRPRVVRLRLSLSARKGGCRRGQRTLAGTSGYERVGPQAVIPFNMSNPVRENFDAQQQTSGGANHRPRLRLRR